jgi:hypothetical protein
MTDLVFKVARTAAISGHVLDEDGEPVSKAEVLVYRASRQPGKETQNGFDPVLTNDLGEFRIFDLAPGRYYLAVNYRLDDSMRARCSRSKTETYDRLSAELLPKHQRFRESSGSIRCAGR